MIPPFLFKKDDNLVVPLNSTKADNRRAVSSDTFAFQPLSVINKCCQSL